jgi:hypothetical protein
MTDFSKYILAEHDQDIELSTSQENLDAAVSLFKQARRSILIYTHVLDPKIFNQTACIDALKAFVLQNSTARIQILIRNPDRTLRSGHRLISLARHLSSYIEIRVIHEDYASAQDAFLLIDQRGMLRLMEGDRYDGICNFNNPRLAVELSHRFTEVWNHSNEIAEYRHLVI